MTNPLHDLFDVLKPRYIKAHTEYNGKPPALICFNKGMVIIGGGVLKITVADFAEMIESIEDKINNRKMMYQIDSYWGGKLHIGTKDLKMLCGSKFQFSRLGGKVRFNSDNELQEYWNENSRVQNPKWVRVQRHGYCKKCFKIFRDNQ